ncbi:MAG: hypothetical protein GY856_51915 [bacterium]|nr:hypothetical protein [bacterium]
MAVVDASVYVALVHEGEPGHPDSWEWLDTAQKRGVLHGSAGRLLGRPITLQSPANPLY